MASKVKTAAAKSWQQIQSAPPKSQPKPPPISQDPRAADLGPTAANNPSKPAGTSTAAPAAAAPAPVTNTTVQPYLTPTQQNALDNWNLKYGEDLNNLTTADIEGLAKEQSGLATDNLKAATTSDTTNQTMAARGMFQSSIRDGALNDIAATLATQTNLLNTNYQALLLKDQTSRGLLSTENAGMQSTYGGLAVNNAQAVTPTLPTAGTGSTSGTTSAGATTTPVPTSVKSQPQSSATPAAPQMANAAATRAANNSIPASIRAKLE